MAEDTNNISKNKETNVIHECISKSVDPSDKKPVAAKKRVVAVPHYLRASTGSCHDSCKYGKPHVFKEKPWRAVRRMSVPLLEKAKAVEIEIFVDRKVKKAVRHDSFERRPSDEAPATNLPLKKSYLLSRKSADRESSASVKVDARPFVKSPSQAPKVMKKAVRSPVRSSSPDISKLIKREGTSASKPVVRSISTGALTPRRLPVKPSLSSDILKPLRGKPAIETKFTDHPRSSSIVARKLLAPPATTLSVKRSPKLDTRKALDPSEVKISVGSSRLKAVKSDNVRKINGITPKDQLLKNRPSDKNRITVNKTDVKRTNTETVEEKTLHMIETKEDQLPTPPISSHFIPSPSPLSPESLNSSSPANSLSFTSHDVDSDADDSISNYTKHDKRSTHNADLDQDPKALKLKFSRGKVVELKLETDSTRRLTFKQGRTLGDDEVSNSGSKRKSFTKKIVEGDKHDDVEQEKVELKHQEMVTKKDEQVLYNNVIEETASKLVQKRKSKVKALVGAFETVISLQERKPSATNN